MFAKSRAAFAKGALDKERYAAFLETETEKAIRWQEEIGLDVLVHGEFERNDMVQYFEKNCRATPLPNMAGCRATVRAMSVRQSFSEMFRARNR